MDELNSLVRETGCTQANRHAANAEAKAKTHAFAVSSALR